MPGKRVQFDDQTWAAIDLLARDRVMDFQELADEAFSDLLSKHGRPVDLEAALKQSVGGAASKGRRRAKEAERSSGKVVPFKSRRRRARSSSK
jgi:hypothetical protein